MIPKETVEEIIESARIDEVVGEFVILKKRGANLLGLCPFHNEKTPSFTVSPTKGIFKCFGCGESGDSVRFLMQHEHYSYPEALRYLANRYGIEVEEEEKSPEMQQAENERESQYIVSAFAEKYFIEQLHDSDEGKAIGLSYFKERGFTAETIEKFRLGYSPDSWDAFSKAADAGDYAKEYLLKTGLIKASGDRTYDGYKGRVIFPIHNLSGRPIGFGGRILRKDKKAPKYVNSPECEIYNKRKVLYGMFFSKKAIVKEDNCLLVEGYTDVISMHQAGIENVVASSGTSLTTDQIRLISRYTKNITILYDGDPAGIKASFRGIDLVLEEGMNVKVVLYPEGEDPDSYAQKLDSDELKEFITGNSKDFIVFKTDILLEDTAGDPVKKAGLVRDIVSSIALIPDSITRSIYVKECSKLLDIPEKALITELNKIRIKKYGKSRQAQEAPQPEPEMEPVFDENGMPVEVAPQQPTGIKHTECWHQERDLIRILLLYGNREIHLDVVKEDGSKENVPVAVGLYIVNELVRDGIALENENFAQVFTEVQEAIQEQNAIPDEKHFLHHTDNVISQACIDIVSFKYDLHDWERKEIYVEGEDLKLKKLVIGAVYSYKAKKIYQMIEENMNAIKNCQETGEDPMELLQRQKLLDEVKRQIGIQQGRTILR